MSEGAPNIEVRPRIPTPGEILSLFSEAFGHRAQLAQLELGEARDHVVGSAVLAAAATVLGLLTGVSITLLVAALVWESEHRAWWIGGLCLLYCALAGAAAYLLRRRLRQWRPLAETQFQLNQDGACVSRILRTFRGS
ncbi:MAG TPA: phage holin family protein [Opitutaceae bacterium]|nr:phage holin family protein [Opitutaceae bacterium]